MIFYQDVVQVEPGMMADYLTAFGEKALPPLLERGNRPVGMFRVVPGTGNYNEVIFINGIESWSQWGKDVLTTEGHPVKDEWHPGVRTWAEQAFDYRKRWVKNFYVATPFSPTYEQLTARHRTGSTFFHSMYRVSPGRLEEYLGFFERELLPANVRQGLELIGVWHIYPGTGPSNQVIELWALERWDHWDTIIQARATDNRLKDLMHRALDYRPEWVDRVLLPAPWSPIQ